MCKLIYYNFDIGVLILSYLDFDDDTLSTLETIDTVFVYIFVAEFIIKVLGLGVRDYFKDNWNKFDFALVVSSLMMSVAVNLLKSARGLRSTRGLRFFRVARSQRALRLLKFIKKVNCLNIIVTSADTLARIKLILNKSLMCITSFQRIMSIMLITFYFYAILGCECLHYNESEKNAKLLNDSQFATYAGGIIGNFQSIGEAWLALFQILTESGWHYLLYYIEEFHGFWPAWIILFQFHLIINHVLRSILLGLIWEVFVIVNQSSENLGKFFA